MIAKNDVTGDLIKSRASSESYRDGYDRIFGKANKSESKTMDEKERNKMLNDYIAQNKLEVKHIIPYNGKGGLTVIYRHSRGSKFLEMTTAVCSEKECYCKRTGRMLAAERWLSDNIVKIPVHPGFGPGEFLEKLFAYVN